MVLVFLSQNVDGIYFLEIFSLLSLLFPFFRPEYLLLAFIYPCYCEYSHLLFIVLTLSLIFLFFQIFVSKKYTVPTIIIFLFIFEACNVGGNKTSTHSFLFSTRSRGTKGYVCRESSKATGQPILVWKTRNLVKIDSIYLISGDYNV